MGTLSMFPLEEFERDTSHVPKEEICGDTGDVPGLYQIENRSSVGKEQPPDSNETPVDPEQGASGPDGEPAFIGGQGQADETHSVYQSTGLHGPFEWDPLVMVFPDSPEEDLNALGADIGANGLLEEITVAGNPPKIVDGKRRLKACGMAGVQPKYRRLREEIEPAGYVWAKNGERRDLTKSQKALAAAELSSFSGPGRPRKEDGNSAVLQNFPAITLGGVAVQGGFSTRLLSDAAKLADKDGPAVQELREAVRQDLITVTDAARSKVIGAPPEVQRRALAHVREGKVRTMAAAVARVLENISEQESEQVAEPDLPATFGESGLFYHCSVAELGKRLEPGKVDLIVALPPADARLAIFSDLGALANRVLTEAGLMVVGVVDTGQLPDVLARLRRDGPEWIMEFNLLFPAPIATSGEPHWVEFRRVALLVYGKSRAVVSEGGDVIDVPAPGCDTTSGPTQLLEGVALVVRRFASQGLLVCDPMVNGRSGVALAALAAGCTFIGADEDRSRIDLVLEQLGGAELGSPPFQPESTEQSGEGPGTEHERDGHGIVQRTSGGWRQ